MLRYHAVLAQEYFNQPGSRKCLARRGPGAQLLPAQPHVGVSAFAYQGTNAHAVLKGIQAGVCMARHCQWPWRRQTIWYQVRGYAYCLASSVKLYLVAAMVQRPIDQ